MLDKDKEEVTEYFNNNGFERWNKIYSESDEVNDVQRDIRTGHAQTIDKVETSVEINENGVSPSYRVGCRRFNTLCVRHSPFCNSASVHE